MRALVESAKTMLINYEIDVEVWPEAINTVCYLLNRVLMKQERTLTLFFRQHPKN